MTHKTIELEAVAVEFVDEFDKFTAPEILVDHAEGEDTSRPALGGIFDAAVDYFGWLPNPSARRRRDNTPIAALRACHSSDHSNLRGNG